MPDLDPTRADVRDVPPPVRLQQLVLLEALDPPAFGRFVADIARRLGEPEAAVERAALVLQDRMLVTVQDGYVAATGVAMEF